MKTDARLFAEHLQGLFGPQDSIRVVNGRPGQPPVCCFFFRDKVRDGVMIGVTYGLSLAQHADWKAEKPELVVCVKSADEAWGLGAASFAERLRGEHGFAEGSVVMGPTALGEDSEMGGFLLCRQNVIEDERSRVELGSGSVRLRGAVPIYECEMEFIEQIGAEEFLRRPADFLDVRREHIWK